MGGAAAWNYALAHPERLSALILVDSAGWPQAETGGGETPLIFKALSHPVAARSCATSTPPP
jgi:pimeloyl-ACP methyl ester carboxylesterase